MASSGPDRSITGMSYIPQWMKSKMHDRYDLEQTMAFSPPNNDDGFFLIRYKRHEEPPAQPKPKTVEPKFTPKLQTFEEHQVGPNTLKQFIATDTTPREVGMRQPGEHTLTKIQSSAAADDSREGSPPFGSTSIVAIAQQMISEKNQGFSTTDSLVPPRLRLRRNSKSLPASPQTSPRIMRKNPFFANIFFGSTELVNTAEENRAMSRTTSTEETRVSGWSSKVVRAFSDDQATPRVTPPPATTLKARPSELREMNFWSPTSM